MLVERILQRWGDIIGVVVTISMRVRVAGMIVLIMAVVRHHSTACSVEVIRLVVFPGLFSRCHFTGGGVAVRRGFQAINNAQPLQYTT